MVWKIDIKENVFKFLKSNKNLELKKRFDRKIEDLKINPFPRKNKHILEIHNRNFLCEFGIGSYRFYYEIITGKIIINKFEYTGKVDINYAHSSHKSGSFGKWNRQQKFINWLKKKFRLK